MPVRDAVGYHRIYAVMPATSHPDVFGSFEYLKESRADRYFVFVHLLETESVAGTYPEKLVWKKRWFQIEAAIEAVSQPGLRELLSKLR
ncbi:DNA mismatch repair protein MutT [Neorhizobium galegae]|uniref:DNA mismatch repair protein MutT n=1 Tax=Neorhizobium galegae TaxID=399 RepID=UPI0006215F0F|nr:DNA mismatch repair protein MutT [Neorhizobium galegae]KAB1122037.1 DNA mismatch repair protein MutT [Neorhizobium galegae]MCQ1810726.1 DNA mismatch repair protein MutT [Neorhizobium galegae]CDZ64314.1 Hypothetical protein NGAL_HAMBI2566_59910 [Neorhizobium galegae bv. orientalis]